MLHCIQVKCFHLLRGALNKRTDAKQMVSTILLVSKKQHDTQTLHAVHKCNTTDEGRRKVKENGINLKKMPQNVSLKIKKKIIKKCVIPQEGAILTLNDSLRMH